VKIPVYLAALAPHGLELTSERADGWLGSCFIPEASSAFLEPLRRGAERAGRQLAALAICAVTAALLRHRTGTQPAPPARPGQPPPADPGMILLTVPEIRRLLAALLATSRPPGHAMDWLD